MKKSQVLILTAAVSGCQLLVACSGADGTREDVVLKSDNITIKSQEIFVHGFYTPPHYERHLRIMRGWFEVDQKKLQKKLFPPGHPCEREYPYCDLVDIRLLEDGTFLGLFDYAGTGEDQCSGSRLARIDFRKQDILVSPMEVNKRTLSFNDANGQVRNRGWAAAGNFHYIDNQTGKVVYGGEANDSRVAEYQKFLRQKENNQWLVLYSDTGLGHSMPRFTYVVNPKSGALVDLGQGELLKRENGFFLMERNEKDRMVLWTVDAGKRVYQEKHLLFSDVHLSARFIERARNSYSVYLNEERFERGLTQKVRDKQLGESVRAKPGTRPSLDEKEENSPVFAAPTEVVPTHDIRIDFNGKHLTGEALRVRNSMALEQLKDLTYEVSRNGRIEVVDMQK